MKNLLFSLLVLLTLANISVMGKNEHTYSICNVNRTAANAVQFEIWLKNVSSTKTDTIYVNSPTFNINFNNDIANGGTLSLTQEDVTGYAKSLDPSNQPNAPILDNTTGKLIIRSNGVTSTQNSTGTPRTMIHYTLLPGDSVICEQITISTTASTFAVQPLDLSFRPYGGSAPVTSCSYFRRFNEGGTGYYCTKSGVKWVSPPMITLDTLGSATYNNIDAAGNTALPVELSSFSASTITGREVNLTWKTATEVNFARFVVERTVKNASSWSVAGTVAASGNSSSEKTYTFSDKKLNTGSYEYRLKMVDNDGSFTYSTANVEATVAKPKNFEISQNYPNPFNPTTKVDYQLAEDAHVVVEIYNITGQKVAQVLNEQQAAGYYPLTIGSSITSSLASGIYLYRIAAIGTSSDAKFVSIKKMVLMK
jgi:hypothetical protein